jgi:ribonuclease HI
MIGYFDGSCEPVNPGGTARYGWAIVDDDEIIHYGKGTIGTGEGMTNNVAEYEALNQLLFFIKQNQIAVDLIVGDSQLIVNMATGIWGKKRQPHKNSPHLIPVYLSVRKLVDELRIPIQWIPREENVLADALSKSF